MLVSLLIIQKLDVSPALVFITDEIHMFMGWVVAALVFFF